MSKVLHVLALLAAATCIANEDHDSLFRRGTGLLKPYLFVADAPNQDPRSSEGRRQIAAGIRDLKRVTELNPANWPAFWFIGKGYQAIGEHEPAYAAFREAFRINGQHVDVARELVIAAICVGRADEAVPIAERAVQLSPSDPGVLANLGFALLAKGDLGRARSATAKALELAPDDRITQNLTREIAAVSEGRRMFSADRYCGRVPQ